MLSLANESCSYLDIYHRSTLFSRFVYFTLLLHLYAQYLDLGADYLSYKSQPFHRFEPVSLSKSQTRQGSEPVAFTSLKSQVFREPEPVEFASSPLHSNEDANVPFSRLNSSPLSYSARDRFDNVEIHNQSSSSAEIIPPKLPSHGSEYLRDIMSDSFSSGIRCSPFVSDISVLKPSR